MNRFLHYSIVATVGVSAFYFGRTFERSSDNHNHLYNFNHVFAKSLIVPDEPISGKSNLHTDVSENKTVRIGQIMKFGFPSLDNIRSLDDFVLSYDKRNRVPHWVIEHLTAENVKYNEDVDRKKCAFHEDSSVLQKLRCVRYIICSFSHEYDFQIEKETAWSQNSDYERSGFDRGHLAAAGNHKRSQRFCEQTFLLTNMAPQVGKGFNRDVWNKLEKYTRKLTRKYPNVYVCTGPLYLPRLEADGFTYVKYRVIGSNTVAVPTHFFKVILLENYDNTLEVEAYVMPNEVISDDTPLTNFRVPPESIERASGLLFFDRIPKASLKTINGKKGSWH